MTALPTNSDDLLEVEAELSGRDMKAGIVRLSFDGPSNSILSDRDTYYVDICLTPRPLDAMGNYAEHWGQHRFEKLGEIFMVPPGEALSVRAVTVPQASLMCELSKTAVDHAVGQPLQWAGARLETTLNLGNARIRALLLRLTDEVRHPGLAAQRMFECLTGELAIEIGRHCLAQSGDPASGGLAGWRLRTIDERLSDDLSAPTLEELAGLCGMSVRHLTRGFRVSRGCSIGDYVEQRRVENAKRMLMRGEAAKSIAFKLGFTSPSSFAFAFRRAAGMSPTQFRQHQARGL